MKKPIALRVAMRGAAAVELAFVSIFLVLMVLAAIDFARAAYFFNQLDKAVRDGARYLSFFDPYDTGNYPVALARNRMLYGSIAAGSAPIVPGFSASMISICDGRDAAACPGETFSGVDTGSGTINLVKVTVTGYVYTPLFPGASRMTTFTFSPISATMRQLFP